MEIIPNIHYKFYKEDKKYKEINSEEYFKYKF